MGGFGGHLDLMVGTGNIKSATVRAALEERATFRLKGLRPEGFRRYLLTWRPSHIRRRFPALLIATPSGRMQMRSPRAQARIVRAATPATMASVTNWASARADG